MIHTRITGTGSALPDKILTNFDIEKMVDTSDEWIVTRTGIRQRHIAQEGEYTSTFASMAARNALDKAGLTPDQLDMILVATVTPDFPFPSTACLVQSNLKAANAVALDISAACSGFLYGLSIADKYIRTGSARKILVVGAEVLSRIVDWSDRNTCCLFGDGAGAVVVEASESEHGILSSHMKSDGSFWELLYQPGCGSRNPVSPKAISERLPFISMQGNEVFKHAVRAMGEIACEALAVHDLTADDIDLFIPHQANRRIIDAIAKRLGVPEKKIFNNVERYGNTSSASIPIALDEANRTGRVNTGDLILLAAFGGGLTWASTIVRW
ncbi:beta-ketoacyl-ACP synthase III [Geobacter sp. DSM 9736]|uniref:beta-ketoacyl-ACP synthase III n=1 Tax=Geobacter sp. DSM 9736 TaxID=1277350 RepID=UPI000B505AE8|nr:beta-ketoacyl-ACP synthase III [Geobacter sp. DSM 9736]SNB45644.1 3-oxoacyl-[acyl-carrier-protein] synthase-3 [Geobacter sp. DSM 9736]